MQFRQGKSKINIMVKTKKALIFDEFLLAAAFILACGIRFRFVLEIWQKKSYYFGILTEMAVYALVSLLLLVIVSRLKLKELHKPSFLSGIPGTVIETAAIQLAVFAISFVILKVTGYWTVISRIFILILFILNVLLLTLSHLYLTSFAERFSDIFMEFTVPYRGTAVFLAAAAVSAVIIRFEMEMALVSYTQYSAVRKAQWPGYAIANMLTIFAFMLLMQALLSNWTVSLFLTSLLLELYALTTYYVIQFHGTVMTIEDVRNIETVNNVIGSYHLEPSPAVWGIVLRFTATILIVAAATVLVWKKKWIGKDRKGRIGRAIAAVAVLLFLYSRTGNIANAAKDIWDWGNLYCKVGLTAGTIESTIANLGEIVDMPGNYSDKAARQVMEGRMTPAPAVPAANDPSAQDYPDIIMILNESWYDMETFRDDLDPDGTWMDHFNSLDAVKGRAVVPYVGGGTNATEYELLTANSMQLINAYAPFNRINMTGSHTAVDYLEDLGYSTMAAHCHNAANYHRSISWEQMGFDTVHFIEDFTDLQFYGKRTNDHRATDISVFDNFTRFYEDMPEEGPRFGYLLTMQNHGGWDTNPEEEDLIRITGGDLPEASASQTNEFISCVSLTDDMIPVMEEYFNSLYEREGRRVVVCMVGDHAPSFIGELSDNRYDLLEENVRMRSTPFFIWRNYTDEENGSPYGGELIDACSLLPGVVSFAGLPLSGYFSYILDMQQQVAAYTNIVWTDGAEGDPVSGFLDADGTFRSFDEGSELAGMVSYYFILEYNNNGESAKRYEEVFAP